MRKLPRQLIKCACNCGTEFENRDSEGRLRRFVSGHNTPRKYKDPTQYKREWNHRNRQKRMKYKTLYHRKRRLKLLEYKGNKCEECGISYNGQNASIFHFHHTDPSTKSFTVGNQCVNKAWKTLLQESDKCAMLCANCHELKHGANY